MATVIVVEISDEGSALIQCTAGPVGCCAIVVDDIPEHLADLAVAITRAMMHVAEKHECADGMEYCERCGGYRPVPHSCMPCSAAQPCQSCIEFGVHHA